jgi:ATP-dependent helicase/nuclease subunit A
MQLTQEQHHAIYTRSQNLIVTAGAGSGKTWVLVQRTLELLAANTEASLTGIVAITFTEKAAREMRDRVRDALHERLQQAEESERWRWQSHISSLDSARIGTIHSLCAQILRANPALVPIDPGFEVLDDNQAALLKAEAIDLALVELVTQGNLLLHHYTLGEIKGALKGFVERSKAEEFLRAVPQMPEALLAGWELAWQEACQEIMADFEADAALWEYLTWAPGEWPREEDKLLDCWHAIHRALPDLRGQGVRRFRATLADMVDGIKLQGGKSSAWGSKEAVEDVKTILKFIRTRGADYLENIPLYVAELERTAADLLIAWREAVAEVSKRYTALKDERHTLDFDDLETLTATLLEEHPEVARRYAEREFQYLMVDEFQDTNGRQRDIVYRLCDLNTGRLFVVGDPKQSIYAFRGADVSVFNAVRDQVLAWQGQDLPLSQSFRTHENLVRACNQLFEKLLGQEIRFPHEVAFGHPMSAARPSEDCHAVPLEVMVLQKPQGTTLNKDALRQWEAYEIAAHLQNYLECAQPVYDKSLRRYRPFEFGDAAILFRALTASPIYEEVFKACGLPYVTIAGKGYYDRQEVWDVLNLLRALHNPLDNLSLASALRSPMFGLSDDALFALRLLRDENNHTPLLWDAVQSSPQEVLSLVAYEDGIALNAAKNALGRLRGLAGRVTVEALIEAALEATAYDAILTSLPDGDRRRGNLDKLLVKARGHASLGEFLLYVEDLISVEPREGEANTESAAAVKIMSIHKSKGLEFPVVVLADAGWIKRAGGSPSLLLDPTMGGACRVRDEAAEEEEEPFAYWRAKRLESSRRTAEDKRLFYVAATRAQDYLLISGSDPKPENWLGQTRDLLELNTPGDYAFPWGTVRYNVPTEVPEQLERIGMQGRSGWDALETRLGAGIVPPLMAEVPVYPGEVARHLSVSQLEKLGSIGAFKPAELGRRDFRQSVLHDAPPPIAQVYHVQDDRKILGRIVHRALQVGVLPEAYSPTELEAILAAYAWDEGITEQEPQANMVQEADRLLRLFEAGEPKSLREANKVLREVPFVFQYEGRTLHGIMDVLYEYEKQWYVLDYKTAPIRADQVAWHAERYLIQVGAYAQAVEARTGNTPQAALYYLHPGVLLEIPEARWRAALQNLNHLVDDALFVD